MLAEWRWGSNEVQTCPRCGVIRQHLWRKSRHVWRCRETACQHEFSVTSGTFLSNLKIPLLELMQAVVIFTNSAHSVAADALMRYLGWNHKTAWLFRGKLRDALAHSRQTTVLSGTIQVDGVYLGGKPYKSNLRKRKNLDAIREKVEKGKASAKHLTANDWRNIAKKKKKRRLVIALREINPSSGTQASYKTHAFVAMSENEIDATAMIRTYVAPGSLIMSDECPAYNGLVAYGYRHEAVQHAKEFVRIDGVNGNQCESYNSRIRRAEYGVFHGIHPRYLQSIVDEFTWREDSRGLTQAERVADLMRKALKCACSDLRGYFQYGSRRVEQRWITFPSPSGGAYGAVGDASKG